MPVYLLWGDDVAAQNRAIEKLIQEIVDPAWSSLNVSRITAEDNGQSKKALEEVVTPPFGSGGRVVILQHSPFCNGCSKELGELFESVIALIPNNSHLLLSNTKKPDGRLHTTQFFKNLVKNKKAKEEGFVLPPFWDGAGQRELIESTANELGLK